MTHSTDAAYHWLLRMCRCWLLRRAGGQVAIATPPPLSASEWQTVETLAEAQQLEPLLHGICVTFQTEELGIPDHLSARWEHAYYSTRIRNAEAMSVLSQLTDRCTAEGLSVLVLKGPAVMADVYGDIGLRPMADLDVLCRATDLVAIGRVARSMGFTGGDVYLHHVTLNYGDARTGGYLELHYDVYEEMPHGHTLLANAWTHRSASRLEDWTLPTMSCEDQIAFDVAHNAHHAFDIDLRRVVDFAGRLLIQRESIAVDRMYRTLECAGLIDEFWYLVHVSEHLLHVHLLPMPSTAPSRERLEAFAARFAARSKTYGLAPVGFAGAGLRRQRGPVQGAAYAWRRLVPPLAAAQTAFNSPSRLHAAAYLPVHIGRTCVDGFLRWRIDRKKSPPRP
jgi:hypothetical protein